MQGKGNFDNKFIFFFTTADYLVHVCGCVNVCVCAHAVSEHKHNGGGPSSWICTVSPKGTQSKMQAALSTVDLLMQLFICSLK